MYTKQALGELRITGKEMSGEERRSLEERGGCRTVAGSMRISSVWPAVSDTSPLEGRTPALAATAAPTVGGGEPRRGSVLVLDLAALPDQVRMRVLKKEGVHCR